MAQLPIDFTDMARRTLGEERFDCYLKAFEVFLQQACQIELRQQPHRL